MKVAELQVELLKRDIQVHAAAKKSDLATSIVQLLSPQNGKIVHFLIKPRDLVG